MAKFRLQDLKIWRLAVLIRDELLKIKNSMLHALCAMQANASRIQG